MKKFEEPKVTVYTASFEEVMDDLPPVSGGGVEFE